MVKILFILLILSFGVWGIGDIFRRPGADATVIRVGSSKVTGFEVVDQVRRDMEQLRPVFGGTLDMEQAKQLGLVDRSIEQIVQRRLFAVAAAELGIVVGDDAIRQTLAANPQFRSGGQFDPRTFQAALQQMRTTEGLYVASLRQDIGRIALTDPVASGAVAPKGLAELLYRHRNEKRRADVVVVPRSLFPDVGTPDEAQLAETLEANKSRFSIPELRRVTAVALTPEALQGEVKVDDAQVQAEYEARKADFTQPEQRRVQQILVADEATARAVADALDKGGDFATVARDVAKVDPAGLDAGLFDRSSVPEELAAVLDVPAGKSTEPLKSPLGWHILKVVEVIPEKVRPLEEVREQIAEGLRRERALDALSDRATKFEDALAGGARLEEAAAAVGATPLSLPALDQRGRDAAGQPVTPLPGGADLLRIAFDTASGETAPLVEMPDGGYLAVRVDEVAPETVRPLAEVRDAVAALWTEEKQTAAAEKAADEILAAVKAGKTLADAAASLKLEPSAVGPFTRTGGPDAGPLPQGVVAALFQGPVGTAAKGTATSGVVVGRLAAIEPADPAKDAAAVDTLRQTLQRELVGDIGAGLALALRRAIPVEIDRKVIDTLL
ncbi:MAG: peptidyl-prolyl cis-trans isomerase [Alphaproteobacteria bacterium]|nr:peptidyl-prolyl cis-trans isomerase [Alphaproteobacteria bacterium]